MYRYLQQNHYGIECKIIKWQELDSYLAAKAFTDVTSCEPVSAFPGFHLLRPKSIYTLPSVCFSLPSREILRISSIHLSRNETAEFEKIISRN